MTHNASNHPHRANRTGAWITARLVTLARVYFTLLFGWMILHTFFGDRWWWLFLLNSFAVYLFLPLPVILVTALLARRRETWIGLGAALMLGACLYGGLFLPKSSTAHSSSPTLTVMSYNLLGYNENGGGIVTAIRASNADVVALQELNPLVAEAIRRDLAREYPYQALDPQEGVTGMGVLSRYPLNPTGQTLPGAWVGTPQVLALNLNKTQVTLLHFHPFATNLGPPDHMQWSLRERERQAQAIVDFVTAYPGPLIAPVDLNATDQSTTYTLVTGVLKDSWREAGWGVGHTFPGAPSPDLNGIPIPMWLVRIDYVFHSHHWQATSAWIGPWDGASNHRPIVTKLVLIKSDH
jgi:endonuclease/exonuclease/phosphatase (EEP) superfamily protein YafD